MPKQSGLKSFFSGLSESDAETVLRLASFAYEVIDGYHRGDDVGFVHTDGEQLDGVARATGLYRAATGFVRLQLPGRVIADLVSALDASTNPVDSRANPVDSDARALISLATFGARILRGSYNLADEEFMATTGLGLDLYAAEAGMLDSSRMGGLSRGVLDTACDLVEAALPDAEGQEEQ